MAKQHTVAAGECLSAIAAKYGFPDYHAIYGDPANASFREKRPNPNLIYAGDVIAIPDKKKGTKSARSGATHKFVARVGTKQLLLKLESEPGEPLANVIFEIQAPGLQTIRGGTDEEGFLDVRVPAKLKQATVKAADLSWDIAIGDLNPIHKAKDDGISGIQGRLKNLGFYSGPIDGKWSDELRSAVCAFQHAHDLPISGERGPATLEKLIEVHGC